MIPQQVQNALDENAVKVILYFIVLCFGFPAFVVVDEYLQGRAKKRTLAARREERAQRRQRNEEQAEAEFQAARLAQDDFRRVDAATRRVCAPGATPARPAPLVVQETRHGNIRVAWPLFLN